MAPHASSARISAARPGIEFLGVSFLWRGKPAFDTANLEEGVAAGKKLKEGVRDWIGRQRRKRGRYWDAMTYLELTSRTDTRARSPEVAATMDLLWMLGGGHWKQDMILELTRSPPVARSRAYLGALPHGLPDPFAIFTPRIMPMPGSVLPVDVASRMGFVRAIEVDMTELKIDPGAIDWDRLLVQAVLVQLHADLQIYAETGFLRVRKCQRYSCGGWFGAKPMDGRSKFCSVTCRVAHAREKNAAANWKPRRPRS